MSKKCIFFLTSILPRCIIKKKGLLRKKSLTCNSRKKKGGFFQMKKIVGIIAAVAMAASVFAVDFTAGFQLKTDLFNFDGASENVTALTLKHDNSKDDKPFIFSVSGDRAGGTLKFYDAGDTGAKAMTANYWNIWFKPLDMLKIDLGAQDIKLNCEHVTWWKGKIFGAGDWGYKATVNVDAFEIAVALLPAQNTAWLTKLGASGSKVQLGETAVYAKYGADFGTIQVLFDAKATAAGNFKNIFIGAGYNNKFGDIEIFADAGFATVKAAEGADSVNGILVDADARYSKDGLGAEAYIQWSAANLKEIKKETMGLMAIAKVSYALDAGTVYFKLRNDNLMAEKMPFEFIALGFDGNMGALAYELEADIKTTAAGKVNFSMPCWFRISF